MFHCDICRLPIPDPKLGVLRWEQDEEGGMLSEFAVCHKECCADWLAEKQSWLELEGFTVPLGLTMFLTYLSEKWGEDFGLLDPEDLIECLEQVMEHIARPFEQSDLPALQSLAPLLSVEPAEIESATATEIKLKNQ